MFWIFSRYDNERKILISVQILISNARFEIFFFEPMVYIPCQLTVIRGLIYVYQSIISFCKTDYYISNIHK